MSYQYAVNEPSLASSNELELILDVYDDGTIQMVSASDERLSIGGPYSLSADRESLRKEPSIERLFECAELKAQAQSSPHHQPISTLELHPSDDEEDDGSESDREPELVELCPCRCEDCPRECYESRRTRGDEMVMLEANMLIKVPMKRRNLERLMQIAKCCEDRIR
ncbi:uncharacterized protein LOC115271062 [Aedes albopictus]|uniref:Uncharacterized protein n=1 Tax=Aedes albopictus TaxID=7160 RepID=A0ABM1XKJ2_AEDAL